MIQFNQVNIEFGGESLISDVSFMINQGEKVGLVGKNGAGKSTLLKILSREIEPTSGSIGLKKETTIGYLPQELNVFSEKSVWDEAKSGLEDLLKIQEELNQVNQSLSERTDYESEAYNQLIHQSASLNERLGLMGIGSIDGQVEMILIGLGFDRNQFDKPYSALSGGWKMRVELTKILLKNPDILLLDEPTNHLDIQSIEWLEKYLQNYTGAVVIISHDKRFLDELTTRTIEIANKKCYDYKFSYSKFLNARQERIDLLQKQQLNQAKEIEETEKFVERFRYKASKAKQVQSRVKQLEKIDRIEIDEIDETRLNISFPEAPHSGKVVLKVSEMVKSFGDNHVLKGVDFEIERGEKIALVGKNGEGKSTFLKMILGEYQGSGKIEFGHKVESGYYAQNQADLLNFEDTVLDTIDKVAEGEVRKQIRSLLGAFLFGSEEVEKKVKVLSGGEKARLALCKMMLSPSNLLILDEPTNHLDIPTKELLKNSIKAFQGSVIIVSHDRSFLAGLTDKVCEFKNGKTKMYHGDIDYYFEKVREENQEITSTKKGSSSNPTSEDVENRYELKKKLDSEYRKTKNRIGNVEKEIADLEGRQKALEKEVYEGKGNDEVYQELGDIQQKLDSLFEEWEELNLRFEELTQERESI